VISHPQRQEKGCEIKRELLKQSIGIRNMNGSKSEEAALKHESKRDRQAVVNIPREMEETEPLASRPISN